MRFNEFLKAYKDDGGSQKALGIDIGVSEAVMSRIIHRKQKVGLKMLNRMLAACKGMVSMGELTKDFRPDIYKAVMGGNHA